MYKHICEKMGFNLTERALKGVTYMSISKTIKLDLLGKTIDYPKQCTIVVLSTDTERDILKKLAAQMANLDKFTPIVIGG